MNLKAKAPLPLIVLTVLILISSALAGAGFYLYKKELGLNLKLQADLESTKTKLNVTERRFEEAQKKSNLLDLQLKDAQANLDSLKGELDQEKSARAEALSKMQQIKTDLDQQRSAKTDLENKLKQAQEEVKNAQGQVNELQSQKKDLETKLSDLERKTQGVELGKIVVGPESAPLAAQGAQGRLLEGKVLVVNKDYNFAVLNLGGKDGVFVGAIFSVYRGNNYIGDVKVEKVHDSMAAAGFTSNEVKDKVAEGDRVVQKSK
ncbi:MAG: hypothetical protein A3G38_01935 [Omnitrophica WOR_2 bacterium RIFCSPLOWO2_12_FULL_51_8]|nr:MAG: hypothetical protein A3G38_01935 [Omnitrophica WOR_2 bacterium RIFCSPLOWO2_12_FULL_51_8]